MYCRHCHYPLQELESHCCPECGFEFDPADPTSYAHTLGESRGPRETFGYAVLAAIAVAIVFVGLIFVMRLF